MAQRSTGLFPREGFNLDDETKVVATSSGTEAPGGITLANAKTIRVIAVHDGVNAELLVGDATLAVYLGGQTVTFTAADLDINGVAIAHVRGALCDVDNEAYITETPGTGTVNNGGVFLELVDGPRR